MVECRWKLPCRKLHNLGKRVLSLPVADPGFSRVGANPRGEGANLLFAKLFPEDWMKMKQKLT